MKAIFERKVEKAILDPNPVKGFGLARLLYLFSFLYKWIVTMRRRFYQVGILKSRTLPCPVISIGNIALGGTGKTPMAIWLARKIKSMGFHPAVISRGYGGNYSQAFQVVSDGRQLLSSPQLCGDEPFMMALEKAFPVVVGKSRFAAAEKAIDSFGCDVIILDDGFQHISLARDLDLVLFDAAKPMDNNRFLPSGRLRDSLKAVEDNAGAIVYTRSGEQGMSPERHHPLSEYSNRLEHIPFFSTSHKPFLSRYVPQGQQSHSVDEKETYGVEISNFAGKKALLFSALAKNAAFYKSISEFGVNIVEHLEFRDHYRYKKADFDQINQAACVQGADVIITTEKDWVKVVPGTVWSMDLAVVGVKVAFQDEGLFEQFLRQKLE